MKIIKKTLIAITLIVGLHPLYAGSGHSHAPTTVSEVTIKTIAKNEINRLAKANKIDKSWFNNDIDIIQRYSNAQEWRIVFKNDKITDITKQTLYVFVSNDGKLGAVNYTGK
jgi:hypothetical protein